MLGQCALQNRYVNGRSSVFAIPENFDRGRCRQRRVTAGKQQRDRIWIVDSVSDHMSGGDDAVIGDGIARAADLLAIVPPDKDFADQ